MNINALFAADIAASRNTYIDDAVQAVPASQWRDLDVATERQLAGARWDRAHPQYRIGETT